METSETVNNNQRLSIVRQGQSQRTWHICGPLVLMQYVGKSVITYITDI